MRANYTMEFRPRVSIYLEAPGSVNDQVSTVWVFRNLKLLIGALRSKWMN